MVGSVGGGKTPYAYYSAPNVQSPFKSPSSESTGKVTSSNSPEKSSKNNGGVKLSQNIIDLLEQAEGQSNSGITELLGGKKSAPKNDIASLLGVKSEAKSSNPIQDLLGGAGDKAVTAKAYESILKSAYSGAQSGESKEQDKISDIFKNAIKAYQSTVANTAGTSAPAYSEVA